MLWKIQRMATAAATIAATVLLSTAAWWLMAHG